MLTQKGASLSGSVVRLLSDNVSVVFYINKQGGTHSRRLATVAERVLRLAEFFHVTLQAAHIRGEHNVLADILSRRRTVLKTEWRLGTAAFEWVSSRSPWGPPTIDLFANKFNTQLPRYFSPCPDMQAVSVDALLSPWPREVCYAFPPITLLQQVCVKLLQDAHLLSHFCTSSFHSVSSYVTSRFRHDMSDDILSTETSSSPRGVVCKQGNFCEKFRLF